MSKLQTEIVNGKTPVLQIKLLLEGQFADEYHITFTIDGVPINILSTSSGVLKLNSIITQNKTPITILLQIPNSSGPAECYIAYMQNGTLTNFERLTFSVDLNQYSVPVSSFTPKSSGFNFRHQFTQFKENLKRVRSPWKFTLKSNEDEIVISIKTTNLENERVYVCFGEESDEVLASDLIFWVENDVKNILLPKEIIQNRVRSYSTGARLGCFVLTKCDCHRIDNVYYKTPASNFLGLNDVGRYKTRTIMQDPFGKTLTKE